MIAAYIASKERKQADCKNDPLFKQIPVISAKKCLNQIVKLPLGKTDNADKKFEVIVQSYSHPYYIHILILHRHKVELIQGLK